MKTPLTPSEALSRAATYCARAERAPSEVMSHLLAWGVDEDAACSIVERLKKENYVDEDRYARAYVRDKYRFARWGRLKIRQGLRAKHIDSAVIALALTEEIDEDTYRSHLTDLLRAKQRGTRARNAYDPRAKLYRFAASRGFESEVIAACLDLPEDEDEF